MKRFLGKLFSTKASRITNPVTKARFKPGFESLEDRLMMNHDFTTPGAPGDDLIDIEDDVLYVRGTDQDDIITVEIDGDDTNQVRVSVYQAQGNIFNLQLVELDSEDKFINHFDRIEIRGFGGNDTIVNMSNLDTFMFGGTGRDELYSGGGNDVMDGEAGNDTYYFQHAFESIYFNPEYNSNYNGPLLSYYFPNLGSDTIVEAAGNGTDKLRFRNLNSGINLNLANANLQTVSANVLDLTLTNAQGQLSEIETVYGTDFADTIYGNAQNNFLYGYSGDDTLVGGLGNDYLNGGAGSDILEGQAGNDSLYGGSGDDRYVFSNAVFTDLGTDTVREYGNQGQDTLDFSAMVLDQYQMGIQLDLANTATQDLDYGQYSPFALSLNLWSSEIENVKATDGYDVVKGNNLDNHIETFGLGDTLEGRGGNDILDGGSGNDSYRFDNRTVTNLGSDTIIEATNADADRLNFYNMDRGVTVNLGVTGTQTVAAGALQLNLTTGTGIENVSGSQYADTIYGNSRSNNIYGYGGNDYIYGLAGADSLGGGDGRDYIYGGDHNDTISGGNGNDVLIGEGGLDTIYGGDGADFLNGDYNDNRYLSDGQNDQLYGYTRWSNNDGDRDMFVSHRRYVRNGWYWTSVDAGWETLAGYNSGEDIRHTYYVWS